MVYTYFWNFDGITVMSNDTQSSANGPPRVFVSYTHENPAHKRWVAQLASDLRGRGVDAILDQWDLQLGHDVTLFMEKGIREADRVLLVCTPSYARKANEGTGGVGYERLVVTGELAKQIDTNKFVCVLRAGTTEDAIPTFAQTRLFVDFTDDSTYELSLEEILRDVLDAPLSPKPPIGANPFKNDDQPNFDRSNIADRLAPTEASDDLEQLYARANRLLRDRDLVGWKQLVRNVRRAMPQRLLEWREVAEQSLVSGDQNQWQERWIESLHEGCREASSLMMLALAAVDSEIDTLSDQRGVLDDLVSISGWGRGGHMVVAESPNVIAYVYHNILGGLLVSSNRHDEAIRLLRTTIPMTVGSSHVGELWQNPEMMGWAESLQHRVTDGWQFLHVVWSRQKWLAHFFVDSRELYVGIRAYMMLAGLLELAEFVARGGDISTLDTRESLESLAVPPMCFSSMGQLGDAPSTEKLISMAVPDHRVIEQIAAQFGCKADAIVRAWPGFFKRWRNAAGQIFGRQYVVGASRHQHIPQLP